MARRRDARLTIFLTFIFGFEVASSQFMSFYGNKLTIKPDNTVKCSADLECIEDTCNEGRVCRRVNGEFVQYGIMTCDENSDTPYCNEGLCSQSPRVGCEPIPFLCPADGVYPDPTNCTRYHICADGVVTTNQCPSKNVYDHVQGGCKYRKKKAECVTFNCAGKEGQPVVYPQDERIYGICLLGTALILGRCEDYEIFNLTQGRCERHCKTGGNQPSDPTSPDSCRKYFLCAQVSPKKYEPVEMSCACNEGFDPEENVCKVDAPCLADISKPLCPQTQNDINNEDDNNNDDSLEDNNDDGDNDETGKDSNTSIINDSQNSDGDNTAADNNDDASGNSVNGNNNKNNSDSDNVALEDPTAPPLIISNSSNSDNNNDVSNEDDNADRNLVNGNDNSDNSNTENVTNNDSTQPPLIIDNPGDNNGDNVSSGNDNDDGNLVDENNNGGNANSGDVANSELPPIVNNPGNNSVKNDDDNIDENLVNSNEDGNNSNSNNTANNDPSNINNSEDSNNNAIANGDEDVNSDRVNSDNNGDSRESGNINNNPDDNNDGNVVNENNNGNDDNVNSGNVNNNDPVVSPPIINNSDDDKNNVSNGDNDANGNVVNGNDNVGKDNSGNVNSDEPETKPAPSGESFIRIMFEWIIRIFMGPPSLT